MKRDQSKYKYLRDEWQRNNPSYQKEYYLKVRNTPEFKLKAAIRSKRWRDKNKEKDSNIHVTYTKKRLQTDSLFKFKHITRSLIKKSFYRSSFKGQLKKKNKSEEILGCSLDFFVRYILEKCPENTKLEDFGQFGYHIDHIIPISLATSEDEVLKLCHYTNLQPLWWEDNLKKSNTILNPI